MKKLRSYFLIWILIASIFFITPTRSAPTYFTFVKVYWGIDKPVEVSPGDAATLTVILRYEYTLPIKSLVANLSLPKGFEVAGGGEEAVAYSGAISPGSIVKLEFPIFITPKAVKGNYTADLELEWVIEKDKYLEYWTEALKVSLEVTGKPNIGVKALYDSLIEGKQRILIALTNKGDAAAENLKISKVYSSGASVELDNTEFLGKLEPKDNVTVALSLFVPTGMNGKVLPMSIEITCSGPRNVAYFFSQTLQLPVRPSNPMPPLSLNLDPRELSMGKSSKLYIVLKNTGDYNLSEISITLTPDSILKIFGPTDLYIDKLSPKESKRIETEVYIPSTTVTPTCSLTVVATYVNEDFWSSESESHRFDILLRGLIEISLTDVAVIPSTPRSGSPFSITVTVTNIGTSTAYAAYAIPSLENLPLNPFGPKSTYIGNIEVNLPTTFTVNLQLLNTSETRLTLPVTLSYMDNLRSLHNVTFKIPINVAETSSTSSQTQQRTYLPGGGLIIGIVTVVVIAAVIIVVKKRRKTG